MDTKTPRETLFALRRAMDSGPGRPAPGFPEAAHCKTINAPGTALTAAWVTNVREKFLAACSEISAESSKRVAELSLPRAATPVQT
jgi:hypothetical protein